MLPTKGPERRQTPRTTVERFAYIHIEPNNGGTVVNVSEGGLCFRSIAAVPAGGIFRFWLSQHNRRIEVDGELAWTDGPRKTGGLRFVTVPAEARELIRNWISQPTTQPVAEEAFATSSLSRRAFAGPSANVAGARAASGNFDQPGKVSPKFTLPAWLRTFCGGLATGLLLSTVLLAAAFLWRSYRRQFGESLIHLGERVAAKHEEKTLAAATPPQTVLRTRQESDPTPALTPVSPQELVAPPSRQLSGGLPAHPSGRPEAGGAATSPSSKPETARPATPVALPAVKSPAPSTAAISSARLTISLPALVIAPPAIVPDKNRSTLTLQPETRTGEHSGGAALRSNPGTYLEFGKFKDATEADKAREKLTKLGFHATVIQQNRFWTNSYSLLVGPYEDDKAEAARNNLASHGFKLRTFERGSRNLIIVGGCDTMNRLLHSGQIPNDRAMVAEGCLVSWESYSNHTIVKFLHTDYVVATANGRWVNRGVRFERNAFVFRINDDGSRTLLEIQFAGMNQALVFDKSS